MDPSSEEKSNPLDRNRSVSNLLESNSLRLIIESLPTGTIIVDSQGHIVMLNCAVEAWFGYRREELRGQTVECLIPERFQPHHPRYRDEYFAAPRVRPVGVNRDLFARRKDGSEFPVDISLHPLPLASGLHVMVHLVDATERRVSEALQRHQESLYRMQFMVENLPEGAIYVSLDTQTLLVNRAFIQMTGYSLDELSRLTHAFELLFQDRAAEVLQLHDQDQASGFPAPRVLMIHCQDGRRAWVEVASYRYNNHEVWLWHDITERLAAQERLVQSERLAAIGEMMTGLAHESRNALQRARSSLEMLDLDLETRPDLQALSQRAVTAIEELQRLYEEVRNYAAPIQLESSDVDLEEIWHETWAYAQQEHRRKHVTLQVTCHEGARTAHIDPHRAKQVFRNILENALAVLPDHGGVIDITARQVVEDEKAWIEISFMDNGPGLTDEQKARIFEPFYTTKTRGTGLGMAIVRRIMEAHSGTTLTGSPELGAEIILRFPQSDASNGTR